MVQRASDRWISITLSVLLHGALAGALVYGWMMFREQHRPSPTPPIQATVVDARTLQGMEQPAPQPAAAPQPAPAEDMGPPPPSPEERVERQAEEQKAAEQRAAAEKAAADKAAADQAAAEKAAADRAAAEKAAAQKAAAQKAAADKAAAAKAAVERARQDAEDRKEREEELKRSLAADAAEERADKARNGAAMASWASQIAAKITHAWLRPPTAKAGIDCMLNVTQVRGGDVTGVTFGECNGDQAVRQSIQDAVYRASPLPDPPDPSLFDTNLKIEFKPD